MKVAVVGRSNVLHEAPGGSAHRQAAALVALAGGSSVGVEVVPFRPWKASSATTLPVAGAYLLVGWEVAALLGVRPGEHLERVQMWSGSPALHPPAYVVPRIGRARKPNAWFHRPGNEAKLASFLQNVLNGRLP